MQFLARDPVNLQFTADLRWKEDGSLWILTTRFHKFFKRSVTPNEVNLRILRIAPSRPSYSNFLNNNFYF
ncbi:hypothetical protein NQ314_009687 [Rhamnusium bicolor]|uniref:Uncharacterized protein n=1 Tax=Rhamnusium bicolor TaxID=1586634 RepID=A0AAV8XXR0_9CUCU|nr:hypothetical protein NQ314_009687 [Rhamnusium bicolor]